MRTLGLALAFAFLLCGHAEARREQSYPYPFSRVWTAAVRMLRVEFESPITEKDKDSGYFLFNFTDAGKQHPGSVEVIRVLENGVESVRVVVQVPAMPTYVERMLLDHLTRKLGLEYGLPPATKAPASDKPAGDGNAQQPPAADAPDGKADASERGERDGAQSERARGDSDNSGAPRK
jgi:hypothetical protein